MGIEQWGALELAGAIFAYWAALFVGVVLYARWRARQAIVRQVVVAAKPQSEEDGAVVDAPGSGLFVKFEERISFWIIALYLVGPPLALALIRFWF
jgi:hypothetical protein